MENGVSPRDQTYQVPYWQPDGVQKYLAGSAHNYVGLMDDGRTVLKYPHCKTNQALQSLRSEADRYARVGFHENLVTYKGFNANGLLLEYCERGGLEDMIKGPTALTDDQKLIIGKQVVRCLVHLHRHNFIHCDLHVRNVFLTSGMVAKVGDLQGQLSRHDGTIELETESEENSRSRHPHAGPDEFSWRTDIFALGTLLYHLWHGHPPFPELDEFTHQDLIKERYRTGQYPVDMSQASSIDNIIRKCWASRYERTSDVLDDMENLSGRDVKGKDVRCLWVCQPEDQDTW